MAIPELRVLEGSNSTIRIAFQQDVPVTPRVLRLIDSPHFQRLKQIPQLGFVRSVYPSATHTRFEHSLGVYHLALRYIRHFQANDSFSRLIPEHELELFILAALLHDIGHWPYCHPMEDMGLADIPHHEHTAAHALRSELIANLLFDDWDTTPTSLIAFLAGETSSPGQFFLYQLLSSPIDIDKLDYLQRDSLHAGVPYGRNFDSNRLINGLRICPESHRLMISNKAQTAAEMMVFARYVMFSEVYWHRTVRSATAMLQRLIFELRDSSELIHSVINSTETQCQLLLLQADKTHLAEFLFGRQRRLYKAVFETNAAADKELYQLAGVLDYPGLVKTSTKLAEILDIPAEGLLIDAAPQTLEVQFDIEVLTDKSNERQTLSSVSPVVRALATEQFDHHVKRLRIFVAPQHQEKQITRQQLMDAFH